MKLLIPYLDMSNFMRNFDWFAHDKGLLKVEAKRSPAFTCTLFGKAQIIGVVCSPCTSVLKQPSKCAAGLAPNSAPFRPLNCKRNVAIIYQLEKIAIY